MATMKFVRRRLTVQGFKMKIDRVLLIVGLFFLALTLSLAGLSFQTADMTLRIETMIYSTYMFISGIAILILIQVAHLAKKTTSKRLNP
jgi:hypothetical protein